MRFTISRLSKRRMFVQAVTERTYSCPASIASYIQNKRRSITFVTAGLFPVSSAQSKINLSFCSSTMSRVDKETLEQHKDSKESLEQHKRKAQELLDKRNHPRGSFTPSHCLEAKHVLDFFKREKATDFETVDLSIALLERLVAERVLSNDGEQSNWICEPRYFNPLFNLWKEAAKQGERVISPRDLVQKLQTMSRTLPEFRYDIVAVNIIMDVVIKQAPPKRAPFIAEDLLDFVQKEAAEMQSVELRPNVFTYNNVMQAWAVSGLPQAPEKINSLLQAMRKKGIAPDEVTYNILLRYWATLGAVNKVEPILETMKKEGIVLRRPGLSESIYCYAKVGNTKNAEEILQRMLELPPKNEKEDRMVAESTQNIMLAYRRKVDNQNYNFIQKDSAVENAAALFEEMRKSSQLNDENLSE